MRARLILAIALVSATGCPRLPPPAPRPAVTLERIDRAAGSLRARFQIHNRGAVALTLSAIDWELAPGGRPLLRGRALARRAFGPDQRATVEVAIAVPAALEPALQGAAAAGGIRLRGTFHLEDATGTGAPAPFDVLAAPP
ncbi:MAG TPA: hypothetical protein VNO33_11130 [Kofleriaceae bacterium]|nr:hypothetical protein [Kofleriaceae bacterium]